MDYIAGILELCGLYVIGNKNKFGFVLNMICGICWIIYVLTTRSTYGLLIVVIPAMILNMHNFFKWKKDENTSDEYCLRYEDACRLIDEAYNTPEPTQDALKEIDDCVWVYRKLYGKDKD